MVECSPKRPRGSYLLLVPYDSSAVGAGAGDDVSFEARSAVVLFFFD